MDGFELSARWLLRDVPAGTYLLERIEGGMRLLRLSEGEPDDTAFVPVTLGLLPVGCSSPA
jgi:hypothetical protein